MKPYISEDRGPKVGYMPDNNADKTLCLDCWNKHENSLAGVGFSIDEIEMMVEVYESECTDEDICYLCGNNLLD